MAAGFHSINVPSEWGPPEPEEKQVSDSDDVSIQLMSPASGDKKEEGMELLVFWEVSIQLMSPASGDQNFHFLMTL